MYKVRTNVELAEELKQMRIQRNHCNETLRELRNAWDEMGKPRVGRLFAREWRAQRKNDGYWPMKPTVRNLNKEIKSNKAFLAIKCEPIILDDGYACCGLEDARADQREQARIWIKECKKMVKLLRNGA